jgi:hypothetical protein
MFSYSSSSSSSSEVELLPLPLFVSVVFRRDVGLEEDGAAAPLDDAPPAAVAAPSVAGGEERTVPINLAWASSASLRSSSRSAVQEKIRLVIGISSTRLCPSSTNRQISNL